MSQELKNDLRSKINILVDAYEDSDGVIKSSVNVLDRNLFSNSLTEENKLSIVLRSIDENNFKLDEPKIEVDEYAFWSIPEKIVKEKYKKIFGTELKKEIIEISGSIYCPSGYKYSEIDNMYYGIGGCGGSGYASHALIYINNYEFNNGMIYVHANVGEETPPISGEKNKNDGFIYLLNDYIGTLSDDKTYYYSDIKNYIVDKIELQSEKELQTINYSNHNDFQEYIFVFEKDKNDNYYFSKIIKN